MRNEIGLCVVVALTAGCLAPSFTRPVAEDLVVTDILDDGVTNKGRYDPAEFSTANARKMAAFGCNNGVLASFGEASVDGQIVFEATCRDGTKYGAGSGINFQRTGPNTASYSAIFSRNGDLVVADGNFAL